jgi:hypothetical protein
MNKKKQKRWSLKAKKQLRIKKWEGKWTMRYVLTVDILRVRRKINYLLRKKDFPIQNPYLQRLFCRYFAQYTRLTDLRRRGNKKKIRLNLPYPKKKKIDINILFKKKKKVTKPSAFYAIIKGKWIKIPPLKLRESKKLPSYRCRIARLYKRHKINQKIQRFIFRKKLKSWVKLMRLNTAKWFKSFNYKDKKEQNKRLKEKIKGKKIKIKKKINIKGKKFKIKKKIKLQKIKSIRKKILKRKNEIFQYLKKLKNNKKVKLQKKLKEKRKGKKLKEKRNVKKEKRNVKNLKSKNLKLKSKNLKLKSKNLKLKVKKEQRKGKKVKSKLNKTSIKQQNLKKGKEKKKISKRARLKLDLKQKYYISRKYKKNYKKFSRRRK